MKNNVIKITLVVLASALVSALSSCSVMSAYEYVLDRNDMNQNMWGYLNDDEYDDYDYDDEDWDYDWDDDDWDDDDDYYNNRSNSNPSSNNQQDDGLSFDENSQEFGYTFANCTGNEVAIYARPDKITDTYLEIPSTFIDASGNKYKVTKDANNGFNSLSVIRITLPEGFKEIREGFASCSYLQTIDLPSTITKIEGEVLTACISLTRVYYEGTKAEWNAITKDSRWNYKAPAFNIYCDDGIIEIPKWEDAE